MWMNLLTELPEGYQKVSVSVAALYALIGYAVVFAGIALLICILLIVGKIMKRGVTPAKKTVVAQPKLSEEIAVANADEELPEELSEETVAVIMAALTAYYQTNNPKCEFRVKRIKRI